MAGDDDDAPDGARDESESESESDSERLDRNWAEILQELRVVQTGTQILTGFLLAIAFQERFDRLDGYQIVIYLVLVCMAALATVLALTPVSMHRALFRQRAKDEVVETGNRLLIATLVAVLLTLAGTVLLIFDIVIGYGAGAVAAVAVLVLGLTLWFALPAFRRMRGRRRA